MDNINNQIELYFDRGLYSHYCTFNLKNQFILHGNIYAHGQIEKLDGYIWIYSTKNKFVLNSRIKDYFTENKQNKDAEDVKDGKWIWTCETLYKIPKDLKLINISKNSKVYLLLNNFIYEWSIFTGRIIEGIFLNEGEKGNDEVNKIDKIVYLGKNIRWHIIIDYMLFIFNSLTLKTLKFRAMNILFF